MRARSMTGRIVDSYTNIQTVKLFSHARREASYAREGMDGLPRHRLPVDAAGDAALRVRSTCSTRSLLVSVGALSIWLWLDEAVSIGAVAVVIGLVLRLLGHVAVDHVGDVGAVREHRHGAGRHRARSRCRAWWRTGRAPQHSTCREARSASTSVGFHYGRQRVGHRRPVADGPAGREGRAGRPFGRRQVDAGQPAAALLRPRRRPHPDRRPGHLPGSRRTACAPQIGMVTQDTSLLHRSVRENILYGRPDADEAMLVEAARPRRGAGFHRDALAIPRAARASTPMSASAASSSRAASGSASPSPA